MWDCQKHYSAEPSPSCSLSGAPMSQAFRLTSENVFQASEPPPEGRAIPGHHYH